MLWKPKPTHGHLQKYATPIFKPIGVGVGLEDPWGVVEIQVHSWRTLEKLSTYIFSHKYMHVHTHLFFMLFVSLSLQAGISPVTFVKEMNKIPSQHVAPCNGNEGYPLPTGERIATGVHPQAAEMSKSAT